MDYKIEKHFFIRAKESCHFNIRYKRFLSYKKLSVNLNCKVERHFFTALEFFVLSYLHLIK